MARPQRKNVDYFPHYISDGKKMFYIEQKYGNDGYASWFKILETLAKTDNHWINLNEETEAMYLASKCRISEETLFKLLDDLARLDQINDEMWQVKIIWSDKFIESIEDAYGKRSNDCQSLQGLRVHLLGLGILKGAVKPQSKVKESRVKESKVKESEKERFLDHVFLTKDEYQKLIEVYNSEECLQLGIEVLDSYIGSNGKKYKSHYSVMKKSGWVYERVEEKLKNETNGNSKNRQSEFIKAISQTEQWKHL